MLPFIIIFGKKISTYMIMSLIGILISGAVACKLTKKRGYDDNEMIVLLLIAAIGVFFGGHILFGITNINKLYLFIIHIGNTPDIKTFFLALADIFGGSVFYGGLIGGILAGFIYIKKKKHYLEMLMLEKQIVISLQLMLLKEVMKVVLSNHQEKESLLHHQLFHQYMVS